MSTSKNTTIIIGAGPVGLAAAAHLLEQGLQALVFEKGPSVGHAMQAWGHVRVFTPWKYIMDQALLRLLEAGDWQAPPEQDLPTGAEIVARYLQPAAATPALAGIITYNADVVAVARIGDRKHSSYEQDARGYTVHYKTPAGSLHTVQATAVIDASGSWSNPNSMGGHGLPIPGERQHRHKIFYGIPDVRGQNQSEFAGHRTLVIGGGHSAMQVVLDLVRLRKSHPATSLVWAMRKHQLDKLTTASIHEALPARAALGLSTRKAIEAKALEYLAPCTIQNIASKQDRLEVLARVQADNQESTLLLEVDRIVVATGFRPDLHILREVQLDLDPALEAPRALAPMIDPNLHSCGSVPPHGYQELSHHDQNFFIVGMKAYGRAPTFLMMTGYEQVRSIAAYLAGDLAAARRVELQLPASGVCDPGPSTGIACCGPASSRAPAIAGAPQSLAIEEQTPLSVQNNQAALQSNSLASAPQPVGRGPSRACCG